MRIKKNKILCIGEVLWDRLPSGSKPGGASLNVAIHLRALGQKISLASRVGKDALGKELKLFLENSGISTDMILEDEKLSTSEVLVNIDENKNAKYGICMPVAWDNIQLSNSLKDKAKEVGVIVYGSLASRSLTSRKTILDILENDAFKVMDVNLRKPHDKKELVDNLMHLADLVKVNDEELEIIAQWHNISASNEKEQIQKIASHYHLRMVCITKGDRGAVLFESGIFYEHPGYKVVTVDTVGAGDAFLAGLIHSLIDKKSAEEALAFACATGAFIASNDGATPKYDLDEINAIITGN